jgi:hypothetical protein
MFASGYLFLYCLWRLTHVVSKVEKLHTKYLLAKRTSLLLLLCSFPVLFVWVCIVLFFVDVFLFSTCSFPTCCLGFHFFCFYKHLITTIHLYYVHFPHCWVCIVFLFVVVFLFSTWSFSLLLFGFPIFLFLWTFFCNNPLVS